MKKSILLFGLITSSFYFSQIQQVETIKCNPVGAVKPMGMLSIENEKCGDNTYRFTYRDIKFTQITNYKTFDFKDIDNAYQNLFDMINKGFENPPKEDIMLNLPNDIIWLHFTKALGVVNFQFHHAENKNPNVIGVSGWLTKKQFFKLFGKKEDKN